jgi:hypothetical protein
MFSIGKMALVVYCELQIQSLPGGENMVQMEQYEQLKGNTKRVYTVQKYARSGIISWSRIISWSVIIG